jgi:heat shock protein HtpX
MRMLDYRELRGVMAHELAACRRDTTDFHHQRHHGRCGVGAGQLCHVLWRAGRNGRPVNPLAVFLLAILAPLAASLIQSHFRARSRQTAAGPKFPAIRWHWRLRCRKIEYYAQGIAMPTAQAHPETAQMMIINPLAGLDVGELFRTRTHTEEHCPCTLWRAAWAERIMRI